MKTYRVWIAQVNQTYVDVQASDHENAIESAQLKWKRECSYPTVLDVREIEPEKTAQKRKRG